MIGFKGLPNAKHEIISVPPDIDELPVPLDQEEQGQIENQEDIQIKQVLKVDENQDTNIECDVEKEQCLEKSILEKIND